MYPAIELYRYVPVLSVEALLMFNRGGGLLGIFSPSLSKLHGNNFEEVNNFVLNRSRPVACSKTIAQHKDPKSPL
jgi:hypothetical protein